VAKIQTKVVNTSQELDRYNSLLGMCTVKTS